MTVTCEYQKELNSVQLGRPAWIRNNNDQEPVKARKIGEYGD